MYFQSALDLKAQLLGRNMTHSVGGFSKFSGASLPSPQTLGVALGVAVGNSNQDFRIAVRTTMQGPKIDQYLHTLDMATSGEMNHLHLGTITALSMWAQRFRPITPGYSVGHYRVTAGTIGALVDHMGTVCVLSNNHVLANSNSAAFGDPILQPGPADNGIVPQDAFAELIGFVPLDPSGVNYVDAAVGRISPGTYIDTTYAGNPLGSPVQAELGLEVWKVGRTTGITQGVVTAVAMDDVAVQFGSSTLYFDDQIEIAGTSGPFSAGGDSGSLIMDTTGNPVALLFAGSGRNGRTFGNPIDTVLQNLDITFHP